MKLQELVVIILGFAVCADEQCYANFGFESGNVGYYNFKLGEFSCIVVSDGQMNIDRNTFFVDTPQSSVELSGEFFHIPEVMKTFLNPVLCSMASEYVLIDTGTGGRGKQDSKNGMLTQNLMLAGIKPKQISKIILTHMHMDHFGGLLDLDSQLVFPNAQIWIPENDYLAYTNESNSNLVHFEYVQGVLPELKKADVKLYTSGILFEGIEALPAFGHTPGHHIIKVTSNEEYFYFCGDLIFNSINVAYSEWTIKLDKDRFAGAERRVQFLKQIAVEKALLSIYHGNFPGLGYIQKNGAASFQWVPKEWEF